jgi:hypothetical protein
MAYVDYNSRVGKVMNACALYMPNKIGPRDCGKNRGIDRWTHIAAVGFRSFPGICIALLALALVFGAEIVRLFFNGTSAIFWAIERRSVVSGC